MAVYPGAYGSLIKASKLNQQLLEYNLKILYDTEQEFESGANENDRFTSLTTSNSDELQNKIFQAESDVLYLRRVDWILNYHLALTLYMQRLYANTETVNA